MSEETESRQASESPTWDRQAWMSLLAQADPAHLAEAWAETADKPLWRWLRQPEVGLVMVRGRMGGSGDAFNLGEMTVTRASLVAEDGRQGDSLVAGRDGDHARLAALFDMLLQDGEAGLALQRRLLAPIAEGLQAKRRHRAAEAAATRVEFFTMVRGED